MRPEGAFSSSSIGELDDLRAFCAVVGAGSLTAAARALGEHKSAVSRRVARFERRFGEALFVRGARSIEATPRAVALRARLAPPLAQLEDALVAGGEPERAPVLRISAPHDFGAAIVADLLAAFLVRHPAIRVQLHLSDRIEPFEAGGIDAAFRVASKLRDSGLVALRLATLAGGLFASRAYAEAHPLPRGAGDLAGHALLVLPPTRSALSLVTRSGAKVRLEKLAPRASADPNVLARLCDAGLGIAVLPTLLADERVRRGAWEPVLPHLRTVESGGLYLVHRKHARPAAADALARLRRFAATWFRPRASAA